MFIFSFLFSLQVVILLYLFWDKKSKDRDNWRETNSFFLKLLKFKVNTIAPIIATRRTKPMIKKQGKK